MPRKERMALRRESALLRSTGIGGRIEAFYCHQRAMNGIARARVDPGKRGLLR